MSDELPWETWVEKRERWTGFRFTSPKMAQQIVDLFSTSKWSLEVNRADIPGGFRLTLTVRELGRSKSAKDLGLYVEREIVINKGDFIKRDDSAAGLALGRHDVIPYQDLMGAMELEASK